MRKVKLLAVGDISLQTRNNRHPFEKVKAVFKDKDILFGNLETVLSNRGKVAEKAVVLYTSPDKVGWLKDAEFDILNIANNHIMDLGVEGFDETLDVLNQNNLNFIGCSNHKFNQSYAVIEVNNTKIGFLGYYKGGFNKPQNGALINGMNEDEIIEDIRNLKSQCEVIIISLHWGIENVFYPSPKQIDLAHKLIDSGATIILGHHAHVIQGIERYKSGLIAYSLGNFQFDPSISYSQNNQSFILSIELTKSGLEDYDIIPVKIDDDFVPYVPAEEERGEIRRFISEISRHINNGTITWRWWFEEIANTYLSGNMKSCIIRIKKYGVKHLLQCLLWLVSPFCIRCYPGIITSFKRRKLIERNQIETNTKIDIMGPYPPPYGGISVHIKRLKDHLEQAKQNFMVYALSGRVQKKENLVRNLRPRRKALIKYFFLSTGKIVHLNSGSDWKMRIYCGLLCFVRGKKLIITLHGNDISWPWIINDDKRLKSKVNFKGKIIRKMVATVFKKASFIIADNPNLKELALSVGVPPSRISIVSAFIPPVIRHEYYDEIPQYIWDFYRNHKPVISANGWIAYYKSEDLYGVDMMIELIKRLKEKYPHVGLIFSLCGVREKKYYKELNDRIGRYKIKENILIIEEELPEVYPLYEKSDLFIRPTNTDGDAVSIREVMYLKIPVVTSDAVPRPKGVVLFKNRSVYDFVAKTRDVLDNYEEYKNIANKLDPGNGFDKILEIYNELAK